MLARNMYPVCAKTFQHFYESNKNFGAMYKKLNPKLFDVTLRDGLQGLTKEQQQQFTFVEKENLYHKILYIQKPTNIEIGSVVSETVLPIFKDTFRFASYIFQYNENEPDKDKTNYYVVVPNQIKLGELLKNTHITNFSFITSVSDSFQLKNTKMNLDNSDKEIYEMLYKLEEFTVKPNIKLYVSCINECPIEGKLDNDFIVHRILQLSKMNVENICLSDTCGTLEIEDFEYIIETCLYFGLPPSILSLHLHVKPGREDIIEQIIHKALDYKIVSFDVSMLEIGGCSVTMTRDKLAPNLSYDLYYKALCKYILKKCN
jgi:isopropylmalate/homocitrate/citramalate synthase